MRLTLSALVVAAGLVGFGAVAQAAPTPSQTGVAAGESVKVAMPRRRMMRHRMMRHRMMRHRMRRHRM